MSLLVPWIGLPVVLGLLSLGCGLALERLGDVRVAPALLLPLGFAAAIVIAQVLTIAGATAKLATPAVVLVAGAGLGLGRRELRRALEPGLIAALVVYLAYGAPVLASGAATFAGYIRLDDTASWMAIIDHVMSHGRGIDGLVPSSYQATLATYLPSGYPLGGFLGLGVAQQLMGTDLMWIYQPFLAYAAGLLALVLYELVGQLIARRPAAVVVAAIAAQPAILYGYSLWGGIKEQVTAALLPLVAALAGERRDESAGILASARALLPLGVTCSAVLATLSFGAIVWIVPLVLPAVLAGGRVTRRAPWRALRWHSISALAAAIAVCSVPVFLLAITFLRPLFTTGPEGGGVFTNESALGNLVHRLDILQLAGIWPAGDFRLDPSSIGIAYVLVALVIGLAALGTAIAWRRGLYALPAYVAGVLVVCVAIHLRGSPWVDGKSLAQGSPAMLAAALAVAVIAWRRPVVRGLGSAAAVLLAAGVLWSNALAYRSVSLAPRDQLQELVHIAKLADGHGPLLYGDAPVVGARHILRGADADAQFGQRARPVPLRDGRELPTHAAADIDAFDQRAVFEYRLLALRRAPDASRPSSAYRLRWSGRYFELWERRPGVPAAIARLPLGGSLEPGGVPKCSAVMRLAHQLGPRGRLITVARRQPTTLGIGAGPFPPGWHAATNVPGAVVPKASGRVDGEFTLGVGGRMRLWIGGSSRGRTTVLFDGHQVASVRHELNWPGRYIPLHEVELSAGKHHLTLRYDDGGLRPGNGQEVNPFPIGPVVLSREIGKPSLMTVPASQARTLCGERLDWIEAFPPAS